MATIEDYMTAIQNSANQINAKLDQITQNTVDTVTVGNGIRSDLSQVNMKLDTLDAHTQSGIAELSNGLFAIWELQKVTNSILEYHTDQNDTIICLLENSNELLCGITRKMSRQLNLSEQLVESLMRIEGIIERVEPAAADDFDRLAELHCQIIECCPPKEPGPERCPDACSVPKPETYKPRGQDWKPLPPHKPTG